MDNDWKILNQVPFADHNAMLDPSCPDITGRVLECLSRYGYRPGHAAIDAGVRYLLMTQESDGSWYGRWGVNYIYGTFLALRGLRAAGDIRAHAATARAAAFLRVIQNQDGGWGESCASYAVKKYVPAESTASQTAWALLGLAAAGDTASHSVNVVFNICSIPSCRTAHGKKIWQPAQASLTCFISPIICIGITSRCSRSVHCGQVFRSTDNRRLRREPMEVFL